MLVEVGVKVTDDFLEFSDIENRLNSYLGSEAKVNVVDDNDTTIVVNTQSIAEVEDILELFFNKDFYGTTDILGGIKPLYFTVTEE